MWTKMTAIGVLTLAFAFSASAAENDPQPNRQPSLQPHLQETLRSCQQSCGRSTEYIDALMQAMETARQSNDRDQMRAALAQAQQPLAEVKNHLAMCMDRLQSMQSQMHASTSAARRHDVRRPGSPGDQRPRQ